MDWRTWDLWIGVGGLLLFGFLIGYTVREFNPSRTEDQIINENVHLTIELGKARSSYYTCKKEQKEEKGNVETSSSNSER